MGQQQLLLIVLGVIIVGIAIVVGINLFNANAEESYKDTMSSEGTNLGALAQQYFKKPVALGGGGNSFAGFAIPAQLVTTTSGGWAISTAGTATGINFTGTPAASTGYTWTCLVTVTPNNIVTAIQAGGGS